MLLQLAWLLGLAWAVAIALHLRGRPQLDSSVGSTAGRTLARAAAGLLAAGVLRLPAVVDGPNLALGEALTGDLAWRCNFLPNASLLSALFNGAAAAVCVVGVVVVRGTGPSRLPLAGAMIAGLLLTTAVPLPLWRLPSMAYLQFR